MPVTCAPTLMGLQLVGLNVNPGRSTLTRMSLILTGIPLKICGNGSVTTVACAVSGSTYSALLTATTPRSYGPTTAGVITTRLNGAPL